MEDKHVGYLILGFCVSLLFLIISYDLALTNIINTSCDHGIACPMHQTLVLQRIISFTLLGILFLISLYFIFFKKIEKVKKEINLKRLDLSNEEKEIINIIKAHKGPIYQSELVKETDSSKVQITRILDKLEAKKVIERKRRGMTNIILLK